jgi:hypothetical protein
MKLTFTEKDILNEYLHIYQDNQTNPDIEQLLHSTEVRKAIRTKLKITENAYNNHICSLKKKKALVEGRLPSILKSYIEPKNREITYSIDVQEF